MTGTSGIFLRGDITTMAHTVSSSEDTGDVTISSAAEINAASVTIDTSDGSGGSVDFDSTINSTTSNGALTITSGGGAVAIDNVIGGNENDHLDGLTINSTSGAGTIALAAIGADAEAGVDGGNVTIGNAATTLITLSGADYNVNGEILVKAAATGGGNSGENIKFTAGALVEVKTDDDNITFGGSSNSAVIHLADATDLTVKSEGGAIDIHSIMSVADKDTDVILNANKTGGNLTGETVTVGAIGSGNGAAVTIDGRDGITLQGDITLSNKAGSDLDINGAVTIDGSVTIDTDNASATRNFGAGDVTTHEDGDINFSSTIDAEGTSDDLTLTSGSGTITLGGHVGGSTALDSFTVNSSALTLSKNITTDSGLIDINAPITLGDNVTVSSGASGAGNVEFSSTVTGSYELDILSGSGSVTITGDIGLGGTPLTTLDINATNTTGQTGGITLSGRIGTDSAVGAGITTLGNPKTTGTITLGGADYNTSGAQTFTAAAFSLTGADVTFATSNDAVEFAASTGQGGDVTLADISDLTINSGSGWNHFWWRYPGNR